MPYGLIVQISILLKSGIAGFPSNPIGSLLGAVNGRLTRGSLQACGVRRAWLACVIAPRRYRIGGGAKEDRTPDLLRARQALSQLSYGPSVHC